MLYQKRVNAEGYAFGQDTPWQHEMEDAFPFVETPDQREGDRRHQGRHGAAVPDGPPAVRRRRLRQDRGRHPRRVQGDPGRQAGRRARADHAAGHPARQHVRRPLRRLPDPRRDAAAASSPPAQAQARSSTGSSPARSTASSAPTACSRTSVKFKDLGLLVVDEEQRFGVQAQGGDEEAEGQRRRADADGHADPAHAGDEPRRHPRPVAAADPAGRPPADPHLRRRVRRARRGRGDPPRAAARGPGVLGAQPGQHDRAWPRRGCASWCPRRASPSPTGRWTRARWSRSSSTSGRAASTCSCARRSSRAASTCRP